MTMPSLKTPRIDPTFLCDGGEATFFNDSDENLHCIDFVHAAPRIPLWNGCYAGNSDSSSSLSGSKRMRSERVSSPARCIPIGNIWHSSECQIRLQRLHIKRAVTEHHRRCKCLS